MPYRSAAFWTPRVPSEPQSSLPRFFSLMRKFITLLILVATWTIDSESKKGGAR